MDTLLKLIRFYSLFHSSKLAEFRWRIWNHNACCFETCQNVLMPRTMLLTTDVWSNIYIQIWLCLKSRRDTIYAHDTGLSSSLSLQKTATVNSFQETLPQRNRKHPIKPSFQFYSLSKGHLLQLQNLKKAVISKGAFCLRTDATRSAVGSCLAMASINMLTIPRAEVRSRFIFYVTWAISHQNF